MEKIKIFYGITQGNWGGAQKYVYDLATSLPRKHFDVTVIAGRPGQLCERLKDKQIPVFTLNSLGRDISLGRDLISFWQLLKLLKKNQPDVLHFNSPKMGLLGALAGRLAGIKKVIYTSHGWPFLENRSWLVKLFFKILCWKIVWLCHETIVISKSEQRNKKFKLIYNGIAPINFLDRKSARAKLSLPENGLVVGTIAELHKNKGLEYLPAIAGVKFVIIGEGEERENLARNKNLILIGDIPNVSSLLPAFDIFVLPSIKEGLPYVILEAGLTGLPVIASRVGGIPEIIENEKTGILVPAKNSDQLAQAINYLISHPEKRQEFGENLKQKVRNNFSLEKMVKETIKLYQD